MVISDAPDAITRAMVFLRAIGASADREKYRGMKHVVRFLFLTAMLSTLVPRSADAALLLHRFVVWNDTAHCLTMTVQQRDQKRPATFDRVLPQRSFDQTVHFDRTVHDWFLEWTIWKCDASGMLKSPISSGFVIDKSPYSISDFVVTAKGTTFEMARRN